MIPLVQLAAVLVFSFTIPDSNVASGSCTRPVRVPSSGDSVTVIWRAVPMFVTTGYMRAQVDSVTGARGTRVSVTLDVKQDSTALWLITVTTARMGSVGGVPSYVRGSCARSIAKHP